MNDLACADRRRRRAGPGRRPGAGPAPRGRQAAAAGGDLLKAGKAKDALAKVREADAAPNKTAAEQLTIDRMNGAAAQRAGDNAHRDQGLRSDLLERQAWRRRAGADRRALAFAYSQRARTGRRRSDWIEAAQKAGSNSAQLRQLQAYVQAQSGDYAAIARDAAAAVSAAEKAGRRPDEDDLLRLADA